MVSLPAKEGVTWGPGWFERSSIVFSEEEYGNKSLSIGHWVIPTANMAHTGEINI